MSPPTYSGGDPLPHPGPPSTHGPSPDRGGNGGPLLGVVIPTVNEESAIPLLLADLSHLEVPHQVVVVDGGSSDRTLQVAKDSGAMVLEGPSGRSIQMNSGARSTEAPWLLFIHADSRLPAEAREALTTWISQAPQNRVGYFRFALEGRHWFWRFVELGQGIRERLTGLVYGDQGLVLPRHLFWEAGGYPDFPIMEDVEMVRVLRRVAKVERIPASLPTSPRRYEKDGRWRGWLRNVALIGLYKVGVSPKRLARFYPYNPPGPSRALLVFAKAPVPGRVKTRLAVDVGFVEAASIYRALGQAVLEKVRGGPHRTVVFFDPPEGRKDMEAWLGKDDLEFVPQAPGNLGVRLEASFRWAFGWADQVVVVGTDTPDVDGTVVLEAFRRLEGSDLVLGPSEDGGYYLLGLKAPAPDLFAGIPWSTGAVLEETRARAHALGLSGSTLPILTDVDTFDDWLEVAGRLNSSG